MRPNRASNPLQTIATEGRQTTSKQRLTTLTIYQSSFIFPAMKELKFIGSSQTDLAALPDDAKREAGFDLWQVELGLIGA